MSPNDTNCKAGTDDPGTTGEKFSGIVRHRKSCRAFLPNKLVPESLMRTVLEDARWSPSACNTQPWVIHIVSGNKLKELAKIQLAKSSTGEASLDFSFDMKAFEDSLGERKDDFAQKYYSTLGIARSDKEGRKRVALKNLEFYDAPHAAFLFMPVVGDSVRIASDVGMYAQTFLLSLTAHGLGGIPQIAIAQYADAVRDFLGIPNTLKLLFGISFGYADPQAPVNSLGSSRVPLEETVTFHE